MKQIWQVIFYAGGSLALGLAIGAQGDTVTLVAGIVATVCYVGALVISAFIIRDVRRQKSAGKVSLQKNDIILQSGETYTVGKQGPVRSGEYKLMAVDEKHRSFTIRVNEYVQEYQHNTTLVVMDGDTLSPRSANVILRR